MGQRNPAFDHHFHEIAKAELEPEIPPDAEDDDLAVEMAAFERSSMFSIGSRLPKGCSRQICRPFCRLHQNQLEYEVSGCHLESASSREVRAFAEIDGLHQAVMPSSASTAKLMVASCSRSVGLPRRNRPHAGQRCRPCSAGTVIHVVMTAYRCGPCFCAAT